MRKALLIAVGACAVSVAPVLAFHDAGVADCAGCHTMHNMEDGALVDSLHPGGNPYLLRMATPSDVCLSCHATRLGAVFTGDPLNPGNMPAGNFVFLTEDNINDGHGGATDPIPGEAGGHSIIAPSKGVGEDLILSEAPGGTFPSSQLGCSSCHDPHGNANFRLLYGIGSVQDNLYTFTKAAPNAEGNGFSAEGDSAHTAYKGGMSQWCANCHGEFHSLDHPTKMIHPTGEVIGGTEATAYNTYNGSSDLSGGSAATAWLNEVPFEDPTMTTDWVAGPTASSTVMCLTCHRAHATSAPNAGRWDFNVTFLHEDGVESGSYQIPDPYADLSQRSLCNKCHKKDVNDAPFSP